jgi:AsmA protein
MRRILIVLVVLLVALAGAIVILPSLIGTEELRSRAQTAASEALGREVVLAGDISLQIFPSAQVRASQARIANAPGFGDTPFAEMEEMRVSVAILPLISRRIEVREFILVDPVIRLQSSARGNNWSFGDTGTAQASAGSSGGFVRQPGALPFEASFGDVRLQNGTVIYSDANGTRRFDALNLAVGLPSVDEEIALIGSLNADGNVMAFDARLGSLRGFFEGAETPLSVSVDGPLAELSFDGQIDEGEGLVLRGTVDMDLPLPALAAYAGTPLPDSDIYQRFEAQADLIADNTSVALTDASVRFDEIAANGDMTLWLDGPRPVLVGNVATPVLDITPYIPADSSAEAATTRGGSFPEWSDEEFDVSALRLMDADLTIRAARFKANDIEATDVNIRADLDNGRLSAELTGFDLYGGQGRVAAVMNARQSRASYSFDLDVDTLEALPFLQAAAGFDRLAGLGGVTMDLSANGNSPVAIMNSLNGTGDFDFANGAIVGVNLAQVIRTVQDAISTGQLPAGFAEQQQTDFTSLGGSFQINNGEVRNLDLAMLSPLIRVAGQGTIDLANQTIDYRLNPRAVQSLSGQGGALDLNGVGVPITLRGDFDNVSVGIDFATLARDLARAEASGAISDRLGDTPLGNAARDILGGDRPPADAGEAAGRILGGLLNRRREPQPEQPAEGDGDGEGEDGPDGGDG